MATRFYLPSSGAAAVSPAYTGSWDRTGDAGSRLKCVQDTPSSTSFATVGAHQSDKTGDISELIQQWVSDPISAQTISAQTLGVAIRADEGSTSSNKYVEIVVKVVSNDGSTVRGTILALSRDGTEISTSFQNQYHSATTSQVIAQANDRIVIEIGTGGDPTGGGRNDSDIRIGDNSGTDHAASNGSTNDYNPWVNFANTISFPAAGQTLRGSAVSDVMTAATGALLAGAVTLSGAAVSDPMVAATGQIWTADAPYVSHASARETSITFDIGTAGTNRVVAVAAFYEPNGVFLTDITVDGKSCTNIQQADHATNNHLELWYIDEDGLGASAGSVTIALVGGSSSWSIYPILFTGLGQSGPTDSGKDEATSASSVVDVAGIDCDAGGEVLMVATHGDSDLADPWVSSVTSPLNRLSQTDHVVSAIGVAARGTEPSGASAKTYAVTWNSTVNRSLAIVATWPSSVGPQTLQGVAPSDPFTAATGRLSPGGVTLQGSAVSDPYVAATGRLTSNTALRGAAVSDPFTAATGRLTPGGVTLRGSAPSDTFAAALGRLTPGGVKLRGSLASDLFVATTGRLTPGSATLRGSAVSDPLVAATGRLTPGGVTLRGSAVSDVYVAATGRLTGEATLRGSAVSDPFVAATGRLTPGGATLRGSAVSDTFTAAIGRLSSEGGPQTLQGVAVSDPFVATTGRLTPGEVKLRGSSVSDVYVATTGRLTPGGATLRGSAPSDSIDATTGRLVPGGVTLQGSAPSDTFTAALGRLSAGGVTLRGSAVADPYVATTGRLTPGGVTLRGSLASDPFVAATGRLTTSGGPQTLRGALASDPFVAATGRLTPGGVALRGSAVSDVFTAGTGRLTVAGVGGPQTLRGSAVSDPFVAATGRLSTPAAALTCFDPDEDIQVSGWSTPPAFSKLTGATPNDTTYMESVTNPQGDFFEVGLSTYGTPGAGTKTLWSRFGKDLLGGRRLDISVSVGDSGGLQQTFNHLDISGTWTTFADIVTASVDWDTAYVRVSAQEVGGGQPRAALCSWINVCLPFVTSSGKGAGAGLGILSAVAIASVERSPVVETFSDTLAYARSAPIKRGSGRGVPTLDFGTGIGYIFGPEAHASAFGFLIAEASAQVERAAKAETFGQAITSSGASKLFAVSLAVQAEALEGEIGGGTIPAEGLPIFGTGAEVINFGLTEIKLCDEGSTWANICDGGITRMVFEPGEIVGRLGVPDRPDFEPPPSPGAIRLSKGTSVGQVVSSGVAGVARVAKASTVQGSSRVMSAATGSVETIISPVAAFGEMVASAVTSMVYSASIEAMSSTVSSASSVVIPAVKGSHDPTGAIASVIAGIIAPSKPVEAHSYTIASAVGTVDLFSAASHGVAVGLLSGQTNVLRLAKATLGARVIHSAIATVIPKTSGTGIIVGIASAAGGIVHQAKGSSVGYGVLGGKAIATVTLPAAPSNLTAVLL